MWIARRPRCVVPRLHGRNLVVGFFERASTDFLLRGLAVAYVSWSGAGIVDSKYGSKTEHKGCKI